MSELGGNQIFQWYRGTVVPWYSGTVVQWYRGECWSYRVTVELQHYPARQ